MALIGSGYICLFSYCETSVGVICNHLDQRNQWFSDFLINSVKFGRWDVASKFSDSLVFGIFLQTQASIYDTKSVNQLYLQLCRNGWFPRQNFQFWFRKFNVQKFWVLIFVIMWSLVIVLYLKLRVIETIFLQAFEISFLFIAITITWIPN